MNTETASIQIFYDTYLSGAPINQVVFGGGRIDGVPVVKWSLPNGDRVTTTLLDYNRNMPFLFRYETEWRNAMNIRKRQRLGLSVEESHLLTGFDSLRRDYFIKLKTGEKME